MSRIGKQPVPIPPGVTVSVDTDVIRVKGSKGELEQQFQSYVDFSISDKEVVVSRKDDSREARSMHGLYRTLLNNMVTGVSQGYVKNLLINGVGYRAELSGSNLILNMGYSNQIEYAIPDGIQITVDANTKIAISGIEKEKVGQVAAEIRKIRPPEPYKGKGIRYDNEIVRRKVGKSGSK